MHGFRLFKKEQALIGDNVKTLITGLSAAIATKIGSIELGVVVSFVTAFMMVLCKMGKKVICETFKHEQ